MLKKTIFTVSFIMLFISATCNKKNPVSADQLFSVKGKILDKLTQWPIDQAIITVADKNDTTDKEGVFAINGFKKSNYIFRISCPSYNTLDTASTVNANTEVIFHLTHSPAALFQVTGHVYNKENSTPSGKCDHYRKQSERYQCCRRIVHTRGNKTRAKSF